MMPFDDETGLLMKDEPMGFLPHLEDLDLATDVAVSAVEDDPSEDLDIDSQELLSTTFLQVRTWLEWVHKLAIAYDISGNDFFELVAESFERAGIGEEWAYRRDPDVDPDEVVDADV